MPEGERDDGNKKRKQKTKGQGVEFSPEFSLAFFPERARRVSNPTLGCRRRRRRRRRRRWREIRVVLLRCFAVGNGSKREAGYIVQDPTGHSCPRVQGSRKKQKEAAAEEEEEEEEEGEGEGEGEGEAGGRRNGEEAEEAEAEAEAEAEEEEEEAERI
jgi:hypothetical protein